MASATAATASHRKRSAGSDDLMEILDRLAGWSRDAYRGLLHAPDFMKFYREATPIDALENARIGSRPARRTGQATLDDLRAIPWVFSWTQARYYLPGWYGAGSALSRLQKEEPDSWARIKAALPKHPFLRYVLANIESTSVSANADWMRAYAGLVSDESIRRSFLDRILGEHQATISALDDLFEASFAERRPRMAFTLEIREQPLAMLHGQQVELLKEWRGRVAAGDKAGAEALIPDLLVSVNAVASGLRTTG